MISVRPRVCPGLILCSPFNTRLNNPTGESHRAYASVFGSRSPRRPDAAYEEPLRPKDDGGGLESNGVVDVGFDSIS